jgi:hypothetical protein
MFYFVLFCLEFEYRYVADPIVHPLIGLFLRKLIDDYLI